MNLSPSEVERFWSKVDVGGWLDCWRWTAGATNGGGDGYGAFHLSREGVWRSHRAHRVAYEVLVGPVPDGLTLDHVAGWGCTTTLCVNPLHLEPVTNRENVLRGRGLSAVNAQKTECGNGHPFNDANTYLYRGKRSCRACGVAKTRRYRERHG